MSLQPSSHTRYRVLEKVGEGSFSQVFRAVDRQDGQLVALKKVRLRDTRALPAGAIREALSLQQLAHPNVLPLHDLYTHGSNLILVLPFLPYSLASLLGSRDAPLPEAHARSLARMMLQGLAACHAQRLLHRDLKPGNLLISARGVLQLADFGQARLLPAPGEAGSLSHDVATRWYRAPELLLGARRYGAGVDLWAAGCIIAQLHSLAPLLPGESDMDQLFQVVKLLGTPDEVQWPGLLELPDYHKVELPPHPPTPLRTRLPQASVSALELLEHLLRYEPSSRLPADAALRHPWILHPNTAAPAELVPPPPVPRTAAQRHAEPRRAAMPPMPPTPPRGGPPAPPQPAIRFPAAHCGRVGGRVGELGASSCAEAQRIRSAQALLRHLRGGGVEHLVGTPDPPAYS